LHALLKILTKFTGVTFLCSPCTILNTHLTIIHLGMPRYGHCFQLLSLFRYDVTQLCHTTHCIFWPRVGLYDPYATTDARRSLPAIPLTTTTTTTTTPPPQQQQRESELQIFDDDGHYSDIHWNVGGAARIPSWRRSFFDDPGHYNYPEFNQHTGDNSMGKQRQRSSSGYQTINQVGCQPIHPTVSHNCIGIGSDQPRSRINPDGYIKPIEGLENVNHVILEHEPLRSHDHGALRSKSDSVVHTSGQHREELPQRPRSYSGVEDTSSPTDKSGRYSYQAIIGTNNLDDSGKTPEGYKGLNPVRVEREGYKVLDPVDMEETRQRARQRDNVEDLYSRPIKKHRR